jgi:serine/threonine protein kinase/CheY-like chemotaxis protein
VTTGSATPRSTILVVDDEPFNRDLLVQELDAYDTRVAASGEEALESVATAKPDLILLDVMMPGIDGFEVCQRLKSADATRLIPIVIMTALDAPEDRIRGIEAGADDFLTKPVDERQLLARIRTALRAKHYLDQKIDAAAEVQKRAPAPRALGNVRACSKCGAVFSVDVPSCTLCASEVTFFDRDPMIGRTLDRYEILDRWGSGGMGCVYVASHTTLKDQRYVIKVLYGELAGQREYAERFALEAEACAGINHPNVVSVLDFSTTPEGLKYIVMEFVPGRTLREVLQAEGALPFRRAASIARQIAGGLAYAHARGLVHRDVKPANVMVTEHDLGERVKLLDFGIALSLGTDTSARLTAAGVALGTPEYMAPEQLNGGAVGPTADLYALGATLYEMITGQPPFQGPALKVAADKINKHPQPLQTSTGLERLTWSLLAPRPEDRPQTGDDVVLALDRVAADKNEVLSTPVSAFDEVPRSISTPPLAPATSADAVTRRAPSAAPPRPVEQTLASSVVTPPPPSVRPGVLAALGVVVSVVVVVAWALLR